MYIPSSFKEQDPEVLYSMIERYNFGVLFSQHTGLPEATHLPFLVNRHKGTNGVLLAHFARANKHWQRIRNEEVLIVFQGPHSYISPSWYVHRNTVPTWNYATVHVYGTPTIIEDTSTLREMVFQLTHYHEKQINSSWSIEEVSDKVEQELKAIVGIEIEISRMEGKFKFNQNKSRKDQESVIHNLDEKTAPEVSDIMKANLDQKNPF